MKSGYPVGIKIPTDMDINWLDSPSELEKAIIETASSSEHEKQWSTLTIPNPHHYLNYELFFVGQLDNDNILPDIDTVLRPLTPKVAEDLTDSFSNLGKAGPLKKVMTEKLVDVMPKHQAVTPMEIGNTTEVSKDTEVNPKSSVSKTKFSDDHDRNIKIEIIDELQLDSRSAKDQLQKADRHQYSGDKKFNPKCFKSGSSVGYINLSVASEDVVYSQIGMLKDLMFDVIPLSRYNNLVRNGGSKAWSKRTALMAVAWKAKMICPMTNIGMPGCHYPIAVWNCKEIFIAHWQIYHIDQHASRILCEHRNKDDVPCHYMTD